MLSVLRHLLDITNLTLHVLAQFFDNEDSSELLRKFT